MKLTKKQAACRVADLMKEYLARPRGWVKGTFVSHGHTDAKGYAAYCLIGARREAVHHLTIDERIELPASTEALVDHVLANAIRRERGWPETEKPDYSDDPHLITSYNDNRATRKTDVLARVDDLRGEVCG